MTARVRFGQYEFDQRSGELFEGDRRQRLPEQPLIVLSALLERAGDVVTRDELRKRLWNGDTFVDFDVGLNKAVAKLREALNDHADSPQFIETLPKRGYRWISEVVPLNGGAPASAGAPLLARRTNAWLLGSILAIAVIALLSTIAVNWVQRRMAIQRLALPVRNVAQPLDRRTTVAVPQFLCDHCDDNWVADGIRAETIAALGRLKAAHLNFISPNVSTRAVRGEYLLEGVVVSREMKSRITMRLVRTADSSPVWAETFDSSAETDWPLVARKIAWSVRVALAPLEMPERFTVRSPSAEARDEYLKGLYLQSRQGVASDAAAHFERATILDPEFSEAWAGLALSQMYLRPAVFQNKAFTSAKRALELNPRSADAWIALGYANMILKWNWPEAEAALRRARELQPKNPRAAIAYATYLATIGKLDEAIALGKEASNLDPLSPLIAQNVGRFYHFDHQTQLATYEWRRSLQIDPDFFWSHLFLSFRYEDLRDYEKWYEHFRRARLLNYSEADVARFDRAVATIGAAALAEQVFRRRVKEAEAERAEAGTIAIGYARRGEFEKAIDWIEIAMKRKGIDMIYLKVEPAYDPLRSNPRFQAALAKLQIP